MAGLNPSFPLGRQRGPLHDSHGKDREGNG